MADENETEPTAERPSIGEYRGKPIVAVSIAVRNAGDGLSKSLSISPQIFEVGDEVRLLLDGTITKHDYTLIEKVNGYELKLDIKAGTGMIVDDAGSATKLRKMRDKLAKLEKEAAGESRMPGMDAADLEPDDETEPDLSAFNGDDPDPDDWEDPARD